MKLLRRIGSYYVSMAVSFHFLLGKSSSVGKEDMDITKTGAILLIVHLMNVVAALSLILSPSQFDAMMHSFAGSRRFYTVVCLVVIFTAFNAWLLGALRKKVKEVARDDKLMVLARGRWRLWVIVYLMLTAGGSAFAFAVVVSRSG
jgi:hypothetical protein